MRMRRSLSRPQIVRSAFWIVVTILTFLAFGPDLRFGPDFRLSTKVINPDHPKFDPTAFRFDDYNSFRDAVYTLQKMFPVGTSRTYVDSILAHQDNLIFARKAPSRLRNNKYAYEYKKVGYRPSQLICHGSSDRFTINVSFDTDNNLVGFMLGESCGKWFHGNY